MNNITIIGNLGLDPEMRYTPNGSTVCNFSVADNQRHKDGKGRDVDEVQWFRVTVWGNVAEACNEYLAKGSLVCAVGKLEARLYEQRDGGTGLSLELNASAVQFLSTPANRQNDDDDDDGNPVYDEKEEPVRKPATAPKRMPPARKPARQPRGH